MCHEARNRLGQPRSAEGVGVGGQLPEVTVDDSDAAQVVYCCRLLSPMLRR
jgi:hypothetical protein